MWPDKPGNRMSRVFLLPPISDTTVHSTIGNNRDSFYAVVAIQKHPIRRVSNIDAFGKEVK
jgi:hypothetical protein